ncbi:hypothetical protein ANCDUO_12673 [Ancylostoma duodenale]|uniref:Uncharacterized protein n=1 Tax=Ancylostoma duodenale TaxID=51022 RepID=A0A0C2GDY9_9BILA|nr:hypothetical protein ANCDUO_12673 [Ancylostoma duodenale]
MLATTNNTKKSSLLSRKGSSNQLLNLNIPEVQRITTEILCRIEEAGKAAVDAEIRGRSLVIAGLPEAPENARASERQADTETKVGEILDILDVQCLPVEVFRMGRFEKGKSRLTKVELPSRSHWVSVLSRAKMLRENEKYGKVFVRRSVTIEERRREKELRDQAKQMNETRTYEGRMVVYKGEVVPVSSLPSSQVSRFQKNRTFPSAGSQSK